MYASLVGGKHQGDCLKVQWSVPTTALSVFVNSIAYNFGFVTYIPLILALLKAHLVHCVV